MSSADYACHLYDARMVLAVWVRVACVLCKISSFGRRGPSLDNMGKRGLWGESAGAEACPLISKIPKCAKTGDSIIDSEREVARTAFTEVLQLLWNDSSQVLPLQAYLRSRQSRGATTSDPDFFKDVSTLAKLDEAWLAAWVARVTSLNMAFLETAQAYDDDSALHMACYLLKANPSTKLPADMKSKRVAENVFEKRMKICTNRSKSLCDGTTGVKSNGEVNWLAAGVYGLEFAGDTVTTVMHRPSGCSVRLERHQVITTSFVLLHNWSDLAAEASCGTACKYMLHAFFAENEGPHATSDWYGSRNPGLAVAVKAAAAKVERAKEEIVANIDGDKNFMAKHNEEKHKAAAQRARAALSTKKREQHNKRQKSLTLPPAPPPLVDEPPTPSGAAAA